MARSNETKRVEVVGERIGRARLVRGLALVLTCCLVVTSCGGQRKKARSASLLTSDAVRYRLFLRDNPVDSGEAFRCYGSCQAQTTPSGYVKCLSQCPGFEVDAGYRCADYEVPPIAACITARKVPLQDENRTAEVVLAVVAGMAVVVGLASVCAASNSSQCNYPQNLYPQQ